MARNQDDQNAARRYLLRQLSDVEAQAFELRLLSSDELCEELEIVEDELTDEYLAGTLSKAERETFENKFLAAPERKQNLRFAATLKRNLSTSDPDENLPERNWLARLAGRFRKSFFGSPMLVAASILLVFGLGAATWRVYFSQSDVDKGLLALNQAYSQERPVEARITKFDYAPYVARRGAAPVPINTLERDYADRFLLGAVRDHPDAASYHALGKSYLLNKEFDKSIAQFEQSLALEPNNAQVHADLGAAYLEKGRREIAAAPAVAGKPESGSGMEDLARSLQHLNKALALDSKLLEALFNRASVDEAMGLLPQAAEDLQKYLQQDPNSKWAAEAREKLKLIEQKRNSTSRTDHEILQDFLKQKESSDEESGWTTISSYQNRSGNIVVEQLLDAYIDSAGKNQKEAADQALERLTFVGDLAARKSEDRFFSDLARFYDSATPPQLAFAVSARDLMKKGHAGWGRLGVKENLDLFTEARDLFERAGDFPESRFAEYWMSFCHFREHDQERSKQILEPLLLLCENRGYSSLQSRGLYLLSAIQFDLNEHSKAVDFALRSVELSARTNDSVALLSAFDALVEYYRYLGNYSKSLAFMQSSLTLLNSKTLDPIQSARHNGVVALALTTIGFYDAAASYQKEALRLAIDSGSSAAKANNYSFMGLIDGKLNKVKEALAEATLGFNLANEKAAEPAGRGLLAYSALQLGNVYKDSGNIDEAIPYYTKAIELYQTFPDFQTHLYQAHKGRLFCYLKQQNDSLAQAEIAIMLGLMEKYRRQISGENNRNTFFDVEHSVFDAAIDFEYSRMKNPEQAFSYLNSAQGRSLFDLLNADKDVRAKVQDSDIKFQTVSEPLSLQQIKEELPAQSELLQYVVLEDKVLIWVISQNDFQVREKQIARSSLNEKLLRYLNVISRPPGADDPEKLASAQDLYSILVQPVASLLDRKKLLCIIPDGTLSYLPFAALVTPSGKYFFEEQLLMTSPSASVFLSCSENAQRKGATKDERVLSVGNPSFDRNAYPNLEALPAAGQEAADVRKCYNSGVAQVADQATTIAVKIEIQKSDVVHLALHSAIDDEVPLRSKLLLAKSKSDAAHGSSPSALFSYEIYNLKLPRTRLVVLSSCQSGAEHYYNGEGMTSIARAFIGAGVPLVVASLWPVDSAATAELMVRFHKHRREGGESTVAALQDAQREMLHSSSGRYRHPYYWAAFEVNGGYAQF
jgi:CHAT domain-containing protein/tetratricopeptide (TPR) repeat protein